MTASDYAPKSQASGPSPVVGPGGRLRRTKIAKWNVRSRQSPGVLKVDRSRDPLAWFDGLYASARIGSAQIPWATFEPNSQLKDWWERQIVPPTGRALVVGCGLGDDAAWLAAKGLTVLAFDLSPTAIGWARGRFPHSRARFEVADLRHLPKSWGQFDFVLEAYTLQCLPLDIRPTAIRSLANTVAAGGTLLVIATSGRAGADRVEARTIERVELDEFLQSGLSEERDEIYRDTHFPDVQRLRLTYRRAATHSRTSAIPDVPSDSSMKRAAHRAFGAISSARKPKRLQRLCGDVVGKVDLGDARPEEPECPPH